MQICDSNRPLARSVRFRFLSFRLFPSHTSIRSTHHTSQHQSSSEDLHHEREIFLPVSDGESEDCGENEDPSVQLLSQLLSLPIHLRVFHVGRAARSDPARRCEWRTPPEPSHRCLTGSSSISSRHKRDLSRFVSMGCLGIHLPGEDSPTSEVEPSCLPWTCVLQSKANVLLEREVAKDGTPLLSLQTFVDLVECKNRDEHVHKSVCPTCTLRALGHNCCSFLPRKDTRWCSQARGCQGAGKNRIRVHRACTSSPLVPFPLVRCVANLSLYVSTCVHVCERYTSGWS